MKPHLYGMCSSASKTPLLWESPNQYQSIKGVRIHETTFLYEQGECVVVLVRPSCFWEHLKWDYKNNPSNISTKQKGCLNHETTFEWNV